MYTLTGGMVNGSSNELEIILSTVDLKEMIFCVMCEVIAIYDFHQVL